VDTALPSISPSELAILLGRADAPLILDVRRRSRFDESDRLLPGARYCAPEDVIHFAADHSPADVVTYCVHGHEVSQDAARALRDVGWNAHYLIGGIDGASALPRIHKRADLGVTGERPSRWITRERPKIDRIACPWLILRFIDRQAQFFYVPTSQVFDEARRLGAVPYDIEGAPISHAWELCSFDALLAAFDLRDPALDTLAKIVRGADTDRLALAPQAAGLLAVSLGLSRLHADDHAMLQAALPLYDALYAWCRDGQGETHTWKVHAATQGNPAQ
jgi:rhodanese-related sulfurtransferase